MNGTIFEEIYINLLSDGMPPFASEKIKVWDEVLFRSRLAPFVKERRFSSNAPVNISRVVGMQNPDYAGLTWEKLLLNSGKMRRNMELYNETPGYYYNPAIKEPPMCYLSLDGGDLYVGDDGGHRTCIARFEFHRTGQQLLRGVTVSDYHIDWPLRQLHDEIVSVSEKRGLPYAIEVRSKPVSLDESREGYVERFALSIRVEDRRKSTVFLLGIPEASDFLNKLKKKRRLRFW